MSFNKLPQKLREAVVAFIKQPTHFGMAEVIEAATDRYVYSTMDSVWYVFHPELHRWVKDGTDTQVRLFLATEAVQIFRKYQGYCLAQLTLQPDSDFYDEHMEEAIVAVRKLKTNHYQSSVIGETKCLLMSDTFVDQLDKIPTLMGFENGVYDFDKKEFRAGQAEDFISFTTKIDYLPFEAGSEHALALEAFLSKIYTDADMLTYFKHVMASMLDGSIKHERLYMFAGGGGNGKSKAFSLTQKALGDYACIIPISLLTQARAASTAANSVLVRTKGRRFAVAQEPGDREQLNLGQLKELTGNDRIIARGLFQEPIEFYPQYKMFLTCNTLPIINGDDGGTWRRLKVVNHTSQFVEKKSKKKNEFLIDPDLDAKLDSWAPLYLSWMS